MNKEFSPQQLIEFNQIKAFIAKNTQSVVDWGEKLDRVRICEYWKLDGATSFKSWCAEHVPLPWNSIKWAIQKEAARLPEHAGEEIKKANVKELQVNPVKLPSGTNASNKDISSPPPQPAPTPTNKAKEKIRDEEHHEVPEHLLSRWERRKEFREMMKQVSDIKCRLQNFHKWNDEIWRKVDQNAMDRASQLYSELSVAEPHTVCVECEGWFEKLRDGICLACNSTGFMSKSQYQVAMEEKKAIRKRYDKVQGLPNSVPRPNP